MGKLGGDESSDEDASKSDNQRNAHRSGDAVLQGVGQIERRGELETDVNRLVHFAKSAWLVAPVGHFIQTARGPRQRQNQQFHRIEWHDRPSAPHDVDLFSSLLLNSSTETKQGFRWNVAVDAIRRKVLLTWEFIYLFSMHNIKEKNRLQAMCTSTRK